MDGRLRCKLRFHKWIVKQEASDTPRYWGCAYCEKRTDIDKYPVILF